MKSMNHHESVHDILSWIVVSIASITGFAGLHLAEIDSILGIVLKIVSIISFSLLIIINWKKIKELFK